MLQRQLHGGGFLEGDSQDHAALALLHDEIRTRLPDVPEGSRWIANEPQERFGIVASGDEPLGLDALRTLIGKDPDVAEEYDLLET